MVRRILRCWTVVVVAAGLAATGALADVAMDHHRSAPAEMAHGSSAPCGDHTGHGTDAGCVVMVGPCVAGVERAAFPTPFTPSPRPHDLAPGDADAQPGCLPDEELPPPRA